MKIVQDFITYNIHNTLHNYTIVYTTIPNIKFFYHISKTIQQWHIHKIYNAQLYNYTATPTQLYNTQQSRPFSAIYKSVKTLQTYMYIYNFTTFCTTLCKQQTIHKSTHKLYTTLPTFTNTLLNCTRLFNHSTQLCRTLLLLSTQFNQHLLNITLTTHYNTTQLYKTKTLYRTLQLCNRI